MGELIEIALIDEFFEILEGKNIYSSKSDYYRALNK